MPETWRLFVAAPLPDAFGASVFDTLAPLRAAFPGTRWMPPEVLHLTLLFMGDVHSGRVPQINEGLAAVAARHAQFVTRTSGAGGHVDDRPGARRGGVAWLTLDAGALEMTDLAIDIDETLGTRIYSGQRPPRPHSRHTAGRPHPPTREPASSQHPACRPKVAPQSGHFHVRTSIIWPPCR